MVRGSFLKKILVVAIIVDGEHTLGRPRGGCHVPPPYETFSVLIRGLRWEMLQYLCKWGGEQQTEVVLDEEGSVFRY